MERGQASASRLANAVRAARMRRGWTRETLAHESGLSWAAVTQIETGRRTDVRISSIVALAGALGVTLDYLVRGDVPVDMLDHRAVVFRSPDELAQLMEPAIDGALEAGNPVLVVTTKPSVARIKKALAGHSKRVRFGDSHDWYRTPEQATARYEAFARESLDAGAQWVEMFGEPVWTGRTRTQATQWMRYESLLNLLFGAWPTTVNCLYDAPGLPKHVVADIDRTHPAVVSTAGWRDSASYEPPLRFVTT